MDGGVPQAGQKTVQHQCSIFLDEIGEMSLADVERQMIVEALRRADGNRSAAAKSLGIYRRLLYAKMKEHGIES